jgi:hypothetical protein
MSTPNTALETLTAETLATATGGVTGTTSNWQLRQQLRPILHSLRDLNSVTANNQNQQNNTMMMAMMAALARRG